MELLVGNDALVYHGEAAQAKRGRQRHQDLVV